MIAEDKDIAWRPIDSAPKDGTAFLAFCPDGEDCQGEPMTQAVLKWDPDKGDRGLWVGFYRGFRYHAEPTHWMPLPDSPAVG